MKNKLYLIAVLLFCCSLSNCRNPWMEKIVGNLIKDEYDGMVFRIASRSEWEIIVMEKIPTAYEEGARKFYIILTENIGVDGITTPTTTYTFNDGFSNLSNINVTIIGNGHTLSLNDKGNLLKIAGTQTVTIRDITLKGYNSNSYALVFVQGNYADFTMENGSIVTGNTSDGTDNNGGGVFVNSGTFNMNGGTISNNVTGNNGGGVYLTNGLGAFNMNGGTITGNTANGYGGGVYVNMGTFTKNGGTVSGNTANNTSGGKALFVTTFGIVTIGGISYPNGAYYDSIP